MAYFRKLPSIFLLVIVLYNFGREMTSLVPISSLRKDAATTLDSGNFVFVYLRLIDKKFEIKKPIKVKCTSQTH